MKSDKHLAKHEAYGTKLADLQSGALGRVSDNLIYL